MPSSTTGTQRPAQEVWIRTDCFDMPEPHPLLTKRAQKIVQLTGEFDREGWNGAGQPKHALNQTESRFGVIGTDLGASFTTRIACISCSATPGEWATGIHGDLDSIAYSTDETIEDGLELNVSATIVDAADHALPEAGLNSSSSAADVTAPATCTSP